MGDERRKKLEYMCMLMSVGTLKSLFDSLLPDLGRGEGHEPAARGQLPPPSRLYTWRGLVGRKGAKGRARWAR